MLSIIADALFTASRTNSVGALPDESRKIHRDRERYRWQPETKKNWNPPTVMW